MDGVILQCTMVLRVTSLAAMIDRRTISKWFTGAMNSRCRYDGTHVLLRSWNLVVAPYVLPEPAIEMQRV